MQPEPTVIEERERLWLTWQQRIANNGVETLFDAVNRYERDLIFEALALANGEITGAADLLGISYQALGYVIDHRHPDLRHTPKKARGQK